MMPSIVRFRISGLNYYQNFDIRFTNSTTILVGESGLGKTKILYLLYLTLTRRWIVLSKQQFDYILIEFDNALSLEFSKGELEFYLLSGSNLHEMQPEVIMVTSIFDTIEKKLSTSLAGNVIYFPVYRGLKEDLGIIGKVYMEAPYPRQFSGKEVVESKSIEEDILIPIRFDDLVEKSRRAIDVPSLIELIAVCNDYLVGVELIRDIHSSKVSIRNSSSNEIVDLTQLSSGEKQIIYFFFKIYLSSGTFCYVLFDEPELSIPVDWQRKLIVDLAQIKNNMFMFVITHSPFIFDNEMDSFAEGINQFKN